MTPRLASDRPDRRIDTCSFLSSTLELRSFDKSRYVKFSHRITCTLSDRKF